MSPVMRARTRKRDPRIAWAADSPGGVHVVSAKMGFHLAQAGVISFHGYDWPGNVRQLENELRRVFILESEYEPRELDGATKSEKDAAPVDPEKSAILKALETAHGNKSKAAELLGMPRRTFYRKLIRYGIY